MGSTAFTPATTPTLRTSTRRTAKQRPCVREPAEGSEPGLCEYPFASSWEGAGVGDGNFFVRYVNASQNRSAGGSLVVWYGKDRILNRDGFSVYIS
ncbi:NucA/NucB deoxyribonuclease domain-containing protein [Streptantibioticus ferralitis]|uniref:NucA/NucB deoxyribonuclease domain-containing protein n=1 Tax=Streptantibioticus ferralitis TaxID=236510 RepID=UPI003CD09ED9